MENKKTLPIIFILSFAIIIIGALFKLMHWQGSETMLILGLTSQAVLAFGCLYEIFRSKKIELHEKIMWLVGFIFLSVIAGFIYIISARKRIA